MCLRQTCWSMGGRVGASPPGARAELERRNKDVFSYSQFSHACGDESLAPRVVRMCRRRNHRRVHISCFCSRLSTEDPYAGGTTVHAYLSAPGAVALPTHEDLGDVRCGVI